MGMAKAIAPRPGALRLQSAIYPVPLCAREAPWFGRAIGAVIAVPDLRFPTIKLENQRVSAFNRDLDLNTLLDHVRRKPSSAVASLFENWVLPGERPHREGKLGLRLAVRNGYANFYVNGQSVAKLTASGGKLEVATHWKYQQGVPKGSTSSQPKRLYPRFSGAALDELTADDVVKWTKAAATYASAEKSFVEHLVIANANVIDLEIALPGPSAPRMDLAVVSDREGTPVIGFWEAKCIDNGELRAATPLDPETLEGGAKIFRQARAYTSWLSKEAQCEQLAQAYQRAGLVVRELCERLVEVDGSRFWQLARLDGRIQQLGDRRPDVLLNPGVVVGAYCPATWLSGRPNSEADNKRFANNLRSYRVGDDSHEARMQNQFVNYVCFETPGRHALPELVG